MVYLKPLYSRLDRLAQRQGSSFSMEAQQEHVKKYLSKCQLFFKKRSGLKNVWLIYYTDIHVDPRSSGGHLRILLVYF